jgi:hypothetical protein
MMAWTRPPPDGAAFFSIYTAEAKDIADVQRQSLAILTRNGMTIKSKLINESPKSFAGLNWTEARYSATEDGRARVVKVEVAPLAAKRYVQLLIWGTPAVSGKNIRPRQDFRDDQIGGPLTGPACSSIACSRAAIVMHPLFHTNARDADNVIGWEGLAVLERLLGICSRHVPRPRVARIAR